MATVQDRATRADTERWVTRGAIGGVIAGIVFAVFEMVTAAVLMGADAFFMPLRMIGGIVLGQEALQPTYPLATAALAGVLVHMALSAIFGAMYGGIAAAVPAIARSRSALLTGASVHGLALWVINFYVIAPIFRWSWFPNNTNPVVQLVAHATA